MEVENVCVVRLKTEGYKRGDTYFYGKSLRVVKKLTTYNLIEEECNNTSILDGLENIINLTTIEDGLYTVEACNISRDYETGCIDDWNFKLVPYTEAEK